MQVSGQRFWPGGSEGTGTYPGCKSSRTITPASFIPRCASLMIFSATSWQSAGDARKGLFCFGSAETAESLADQGVFSDLKNETP